MSTWNMLIETKSEEDARKVKKMFSLIDEIYRITLSPKSDFKKVVLIQDAYQVFLEQNALWKDK